MKMKWIDKDSGPQIYDTFVPDGEWRYEDYDRWLHHPQGYETRARITRKDDGYKWIAWPPYPERGELGSGTEETLEKAKFKVEALVG